MEVRNFHVPSLGRAGVSPTLNYLKNQGLSSSTHIWIYADQEQDYRDNYSDMNIHICNFEGRNFTKKMNLIKDYIVESKQPGLILDDDLNQFIIGKTKYSDNKVVKTLDFTLVYDLLNRAAELCPEVVAFCTKRNFITTYLYNNHNLFTKFSVPSGLIFMTGKECISRCDDATNAEDIGFVTECWLNKEIALKMNLIFAKFTFGTNAGGLQSGSTNFKESTKNRLEKEHQFMVEKYDNECTYTLNEKNGYFGSNGVKVKQWLLDTGKYTVEEMKDLDAKIKDYSNRVYNDEIFNEILSKVHNNKYNIFKERR